MPNLDIPSPCRFLSSEEFVHYLDLPFFVVRYKLNGWDGLTEMTCAFVNDRVNSGRGHGSHLVGSSVAVVEFAAVSCLS